MSASKIDFSELRKALAGLSGSVKALRVRIETLKRQREDIATAPTARADIQAMLAAWLDEQAGQYRKNVGVMLMAFIKRATWVSEHARVADAVTLVAATPTPGANPTFRTVDAAVIGLLLPQIRENLPKLIDAVEWPGPEGLPLKERTAELARLDEEISRLEAEEAALVAQAASAGVVLDGGLCHE